MVGCAFGDTSNIGESMFGRVTFSLHGNVVEDCFGEDWQVNSHFVFGGTMRVSEV